MKSISIKTQKILSFIPILNLFIIFIWTYNVKVQYSIKEFLSSLIFILRATIIYVIYLILSYIFKDISSFLFIIIEYIIPLDIGLYLVKYQESLSV